MNNETLNRDIRQLLPTAAAAPDDEIKLLWRVAEHTNAARSFVNTMWDSPAPMHHGNAVQLRARLSLAYAAALALERRLAGEPKPEVGP